jgi:nitrilase
VTRKVRVAAIQAEPRWLEQAVGVDQVVELIAEAGREGADLVAAFLPGNPWWIWLDSGMQFVARYSANSEAVHLRGDRC